MIGVLGNVVVIGFSWEVVGGDWGGGGWLAILKKYWVFNFLEKKILFTIVFSKKRTKRMVAKANVMTAFFIHLHIVIIRDVIRRCEKNYEY